MDRGSDTIISERGSSTRPPLHIDDSQIDGDSVFPSSPVGHVTEMTFFSMECLCTAVVRSLNFVEVSYKCVVMTHCNPPADIL